MDILKTIYEEVHVKEAKKVHTHLLPTLKCKQSKLIRLYNRSYNYSIKYTLGLLLVVGNSGGDHSATLNTHLVGQIHLRGAALSQSQLLSVVFHRLAVLPQVCVRCSQGHVDYSKLPGGLSQCLSALKLHTT